MTKKDSESKKNYSNSYNKTVNIGPGGPVPFYYTIKVLDKITKLFSGSDNKSSEKKPQVEKSEKKPKVVKTKKSPKIKDY